MSDGYQVSPKLLSFQWVLSFLRWLIRVRSFFLQECAHPARHRSPRGSSDRGDSGDSFAKSLAHGFRLQFLRCLHCGSHAVLHAKRKKRLLAYLAFASPPLYTAIGVLCFLLHAPRADYLIWVLLWIALIAFALRKDDRVVITNRSRPMPVRLRMAHGMSALTILLVFLVGHMTNHVIGIWNLASDIEVTGILGTIYRGSWLQPELVGLFVFQIISRLVLLGSRMTRSADLPGALQTTSEMYLAAFLISHMTAVFILDRIVLKVGPLSKTSRFGTSPCNGRSVLCKSELIEMK
jgi:hypothetical protein